MRNFTEKFFSLSLEKSVEFFTMKKSFQIYIYNRTIFVHLFYYWILICFLKFFFVLVCNIFYDKKKFYNYCWDVCKSITSSNMLKSSSSSPWPHVSLSVAHVHLLVVMFIRFVTLRWCSFFLLLIEFIE